MFNIITPTYNRRHLLHRVYESLKSQTLIDFKWIIVDDCSTDDTKTLVDEWKSESNGFLIEYYYFEKNQGKSYAVNFALEFCDRHYTIIADSDDTFNNNTIYELTNIWNTIKLIDHNDKIACVWTLVKNEEGKIVGDRFPKNFWQVSFKERILKNDIIGEKWHCWRTSVLKERPMYLGNNCHVPESATWNAINSKYDFLCINIAHRVYYHSEDGLIASKKSRIQISSSEYYNSYYELKDMSIIEIIKYKHFRSLAFNYVKSKFFYTDNKLRLSINQYLISLAIFLINAPYRILNKLV